MVRDGMGWFTRWGLISYLLVDYGCSVGQKNSRSHFKLILCCFWFIISPHTNFIQIGQKTEVRNFSCCPVLVGRAGKPKNGRRHSKLFLSCFCSISSPHTKFNPNPTKNTEVRDFHLRSI